MACFRPSRYDFGYAALLLDYFLRKINPHNAASRIRVEP